MKITFYKYHGAGNDFVIVDDRKLNYSFSTNEIKEICDRKFGIGSDGFILLRNHIKYDFEMIYYNSDGKTSTMCGNGGRCIVAFANYLKIIKTNTVFQAIDGAHEAIIINDSSVLLKMNNIDHISSNENYTFIAGLSFVGRNDDQTSGTTYHNTTNLYSARIDFSVVKASGADSFGLSGKTYSENKVHLGELGNRSLE